MLLEILSPEACLFTGQVTSVSFPGVRGRFEVWPGHAPMMAALKAGDIEYATAAGPTVCPTTGGFAEILGDRVTACIEQVFVSSKEETVPPPDASPSE